MGWVTLGRWWKTLGLTEKEIFIDNLLVRIHFFIVMIRWNGLARRKFELPSLDSLTSTFLGITDLVNPNRLRLRLEFVNLKPYTLNRGTMVA